MDKVKQSMLASTVLEARIIPNGVDLSVFHSADKQATRSVLDVPQNAKVLVFAANGARRNKFKDYNTMRAAIYLVGKRLHRQNVLFIALGEEAPAERIGQTEIRFIPYQKSSETVARYYQSADVYVHAARADTFPLAVLEALACGAPVVATGVGGIPEQIKSIGDTGSFGTAKPTGIIVPPGDAQAMAVGIEKLLTNEFLRQRLSENAAADAKERFDLRRQVDDYLAWYKELLQRCALQTTERHALFGAQKTVKVRATECPE
jgi:glycosyltransferase involved in cell wall biosynthesis